MNRGVGKNIITNIFRQPRYVSIMRRYNSGNNGGSDWHIYIIEFAVGWIGVDIYKWLSR